MTQKQQEQKEIATTIINQLGGNKFRAMTGANNFVATKSGVQFKFKGSRKVNCCVITLDPSDTYTVEFWKIKRNCDFDMIESSDMIYADMLPRIFESETGLRTSL